MITRKNLLYSTFIGLPVQIINSSQRKLVGLEGTIVDETKNLIAVEKPDGSVVKLQKVSCVFRFTMDSGEKADVDGNSIAFRPYERPKKV
ncbi:ribonuclease P protein subunit [Candidatus Micrarchaeota archaeon]|nr:ribonuclease P protein subunit [Candidatus Micrarchaeota archaeon]